MDAPRRSWLAWGGLILLAGCSQAPSSPLEKARASYRAADWDAAVAACDDALRESPESIAALLLRGQANLAAARPESAAKDFSEVIRLAPDNPEGYYHRALAYEALGKNEDSTADRNYARAIDRQDAALLRRHVESLRMPEMVRSEPDEKKPAGKSKVVAKDEPQPADDSITDSFARREAPVEEKANEPAAPGNPLLSPLTIGESGLLGEPLRGSSLLDSPIFKTPLAPSPAEKPKSASDNEDKKPKRKEEQAGQSKENSQPQPGERRTGVAAAAQSKPIQIHGRPYVADPSTGYGGQRGEVEETPTWRQPKYPTARLDFTAPFGVPGTASKTGVGPFQRPVGSPNFGSNLGPTPAAPLAGSSARPLVLTPQLRGFTPDTPPLPLVPPTPSLPALLPLPSPAPSGR